MTINNTELDQLIRTTIEDLVDYDLDKLENGTRIEEIGLVSLDYVTLSVAIQKEYGKELDLDALEESNLETYGQFVNYIAS